jgi:hypothetical protein
MLGGPLAGLLIQEGLAEFVERNALGQEMEGRNQGTAERLGVRWWVGYDRPSFWLAGEQKWDGFCAWWKPGSRVRAEAST